MRHFPNTLCLILFAGIVSAATVLPSSGGEPSPKCPMTTQACLDAMAGAWKDRGWAGLEIKPDPGTSGAAQLVVEVYTGSPAATAGILKGDLLVAVNETRIEKGSDAAWTKVLREAKPGATITYGIKRGGAELRIPVTLILIPRYVLAGHVGRHMLVHVRPPQ